MQESEPKQPSKKVNSLLNESIPSAMVDNKLTCDIVDLAAYQKVLKDALSPSAEMVKALEALRSPLSHIADTDLRKFAINPSLHQLSNTLNDLPLRQEIFRSKTDRILDVGPSPIIEAQRQFNKQAAVRQQLAEEQTDLLRRIVEASQVAVATAERNEKLAIADATRSHNLALWAIVVALLGILAGVIGAWESIQKFVLLAS